MQPLALIRAAIKAVPAVKYALGVAGIIAVVAIIYSFGIGLWVAFVGGLVVMVLMVVLVIFAKLTKTAPIHFLKPVIVLTWAFLLLTIFAAVCLFTSVFFRKPIDLIVLLHWKNTPTATNSTPVTLTNATALNADSLIDKSTPLAPTNQTRRDPEIETRLSDGMQVAQLLQDTGDFSGAWQSLELVSKAGENSEKFRSQQLQLAQAWLRDARKKEGETFLMIVNQVGGVVSLATASTNPSIAADAMAHLGWGNFLKWRDGVQGLKIEDLYTRALKVDPQNVYAHTMLGHWILWRNRSEKEAMEHFDKAVQSGRDRAFVRRLQISALLNTADDKKEIQLIRVVDEMRKNNEPPDKENWRIIESRVYSFMKPETLEQTTRFISATDHLATYRWLTQKVEEPNMIQRYIVARLTEMTGDAKTALSLYQQIKSDSDFQLFTRSKEVLDGIARCEQALNPK